MSQSELRNFEKSMAYHLAPAMLGIKPACLMSMEKNKDGLEENVELFNSRAYTKGMKLTVLCECKSRKLLFLYNEKLLSDRLADNRVRKLLESFGYDSRMTLEQQLERLSGRISASEDFPHEIGLFLGYPLGDVIGFIKNAGQNCKCVGCWKVYCNECEAVKAFARFKKCTSVYVRLWNQGRSVRQLTVAA